MSALIRSLAIVMGEDKAKALSLVNRSEKTTHQNSSKFMFTLPVFTNFPADFYLFKANNKCTRKRCEICSKLTIKTPERRHWRSTGVFIVNFEHISPLFLVFFVDFEHANVSWVSLSTILNTSRCVFRTLSNIKGGVLCENSSWLSTVNYFRKKDHLRCLTWFVVAFSLW